MPITCYIRDRVMDVLHVLRDTILQCTLPHGKFKGNVKWFMKEQN